jgi:hypothetical protein
LLGLLREERSIAAEVHWLVGSRRF